MAECSVTDVISAVAGLWKLGVTVALPLCIWFLRKPLATILPNLKKIKRGETEIELHEKAEIPAPQAEVPSRAVPPEKEQALPKPPPLEDRPFQMKLLDALINRNVDEAERLFEEEIRTDPDKRLEHDVFYTSLRCDFLKDAQCAAKLEGFRSDKKYESQLDGILYTLGRYYETTEQYDKALNQYRAAEKSARKSKDRALARAAQGRCLSTSGDVSGAIALITQSVAEFEDAESLAAIYSALADVHKTQGNKLESALALEKVVQFSPTDTDALFNAAYAQSACELPYLSLHNYLRELRIQPTQSMARNNCAVQWAELGLPLKAVEQYRRAQKDGNTLSMSNLAFLLLDKGFGEDASNLLQEAQKIKNYHGNVDRALSKLRSDREQEEEKSQTVQKWGSTYQTFIREFAEAFLIPCNKSVTLSGTWKGADGDTVAISQKGSVFSAEWGKQHSRCKITGTQTNRSGRGKFFVERAGLFASMSDKPSYAEPRDVLFVLSADGQVLSVISTGKSEPLHLKFKRAADEPAEQRGS